MNLAGGAQPDNPLLRKARGAFFTPPAVSAFLARWGIRTSIDRVMEPSCGEASFLLAAAAHIRKLKVSENEPFLFNPLADSAQLVGIEIHPESAKTASALLAGKGADAEVIPKDFFDVLPSADFEVILGNPPFVRYQNFTGDARQKSLRAALKGGVNLSGLASSWAAFVVHAALFLKPTGRLGMVLPAELLSVHYAAPVRRFLLRHFASLTIVVFERLIFEDALEDVVLLMAEGTGGCDSINVVQVRDADDLPPAATTSVLAKNLRDDRWTGTLVKADAWEAFTEVSDGPLYERLSDWGTTYLGAVTGENKFFCLSDAEVAEAGIRPRDLLRVSPPGSRHLRELDFTEAAWGHTRADGRRCWLFYPKKSGDLAPEAKAYIAAGEFRGIYKGYKCSMRTPWWRVPLVPKPDLFLTYMDHERPRLVTNSAGAQHLNSLYGVRLKRARKEIGAAMLPLASLNTVSLLGAEVHGRSYGGGMLKLEPREADKIPTPSLAVVEKHRVALQAIRPQVAHAIERNDVAKAVSMVDKIIWSKEPEAGRMLETLRQAREFLFQRRHTRSRGRSDE